MDKNHSARVINELKAAGINSFGLLRSESRYLPHIIQPDEHIGAAIIGFTPQGAAMLVATDKRVIFLDKKPLFVTQDELGYLAVSGVRLSTGGVYAELALHTKVSDYVLRRVSKHQAQSFEQFINKHRLLAMNETTPKPEEQVTKLAFSQSAKKFLNQQSAAVFSSTDRTGNIYGAVVYYLLKDEVIYFVTKSQTTKGRNIYAGGQVALTVFDEAKLRTVQISGHAEIEQDPTTKRTIIDALVKPRDYDGESRLPPISQIVAGEYLVVKVLPNQVKFTDFKNKP